MDGREAKGRYEEKVSAKITEGQIETTPKKVGKYVEMIKGIKGDIEKKERR